MKSPLELKQKPLNRFVRNAAYYASISLIILTCPGYCHAIQNVTDDQESATGSATQNKATRSVIATSQPSQSTPTSTDTTGMISSSMDSASMYPSDIPEGLLKESGWEEGYSERESWKDYRFMIRIAGELENSEEICKEKADQVFIEEVGRVFDKHFLHQPGAGKQILSDPEKREYVFRLGSHSKDGYMAKVQTADGPRFQYFQYMTIREDLINRLKMVHNRTLQPQRFAVVGLSLLSVLGLVAIAKRSLRSPEHKKML